MSNVVLFKKAIPELVYLSQYLKGSFTNEVITGGVGGGLEKMTFDDLIKKLIYKKIANDY